MQHVTIPTYEVNSDQDNYEQKFIGFFREMALKSDDQNYKYHFEYEIEKRKTKITLVVKNLTTKDKFRILINNTLDGNEFPISQKRLFFVNEYIFLSYVMNKRDFVFYFNMENQIGRIFRFKLEFILSEKYICCKFDEYIIISNVEHDKILLFFDSENKKIKIEAELIITSLEKMIREKIDEKYSIEFTDMLNGSFPNIEVKVDFKDCIAFIDIEHLYRLGSDFIDEQIEGEDGIHLPLTTFDEFRRSDFKFLHFINCKSENRWVKCFQMMI